MVDAGSRHWRHAARRGRAPRVAGARTPRVTGGGGKRAARRGAPWIQLRIQTMMAEDDCQGGSCFETV